MAYIERIKAYKFFEIKVSAADLKSPSALTWGGDYNYLVVPDGLEARAMEFLKSDPNQYSGVGLWCLRERYFSILRKARARSVHSDTKAVYYWSLFRSMARQTMKLGIKEIKE